MTVAPGINEVDAVEAGRIPSACIALACIALIHHVFHLGKGFFNVRPFFNARQVWSKEDSFVPTCHLDVIM